MCDCGHAARPPPQAPAGWALSDSAARRRVRSSAGRQESQPLEAGTSERWRQQDGDLYRLRHLPSSSSRVAVGRPCCPLGTCDTHGCTICGCSLDAQGPAPGSCRLAAGSCAARGYRLQAGDVGLQAGYAGLQAGDVGLQAGDVELQPTSTSSAVARIFGSSSLSAATPRGPLYSSAVPCSRSTRTDAGLGVERGKGGGFGTRRQVVP